MITSAVGDMSIEEMQPPKHVNEVDMLPNGTRELRGRVVDVVGQPVSGSITLWCCPEGEWSSLQESGSLGNALKCALLHGAFDVRINFPGVYGPTYLPPHVKYAVSDGAVEMRGAVAFGAIPIRFQQQATFVTVVV